MYSNKFKSGFTLTELLVVLVIIGLLAALVGPSLYQRIKPARQSVAAAQLEHFVTAIENFYIDTGRYPYAHEGLQVLYKSSNEISNWKGPYLKKLPPKDPWGYEYQYKILERGQGFSISSYGADGKQGGEGDNRDINSWENN